MQEHEARKIVAKLSAMTGVCASVPGASKTPWQPQVATGP